MDKEKGRLKGVVVWSEVALKAVEEVVAAEMVAAPTVVDTD